MIAITVAVLSVVLSVLHLFVSKVPRTPFRVIHILLLYALVLDDNPDTFFGSGTVYIDDITTWRQDTVPTPAASASWRPST